MEWTAMCLAYRWPGDRPDLRNSKVRYMPLYRHKFYIVTREGAEAKKKKKKIFSEKEAAVLRKRIRAVCAEPAYTAFLCKTEKNRRMKRNEKKNFKSHDDAVSFGSTSCRMR